MSYDAVESLYLTKLYVCFTCGIHRVVGPFNKSCLQLALVHFLAGGGGVTLAGSACRVKGVKFARQAITQE